MSVTDTLKAFQDVVGRGKPLPGEIGDFPRGTQLVNMTACLAFHFNKETMAKSFFIWSVKPSILSCMD
jgi:hypothetical protein